MSTFIICGIVAVAAIIGSSIYFNEMMSRMKEHIKSLNDALSSQKFTINELEVQCIKYKGTIKQKEEIINQKNIDNEKLSLLNIELKRTNTRLLKQASDDITVNVKAGDDATIILPTKKKRGRPKKKTNGRSNTNNGSVPKGKQ